MRENSQINWRQIGSSAMASFAGVLASLIAGRTIGALFDRVPLRHALSASSIVKLIVIAVCIQPILWFGVWASSRFCRPD